MQKFFHQLVEKYSFNVSRFFTFELLALWMQKFSAQKDVHWKDGDFATPFPTFKFRFEQWQGERMSRWAEVTPKWWLIVLFSAFGNSNLPRSMLMPCSLSVAWRCCATKADIRKTSCVCEAFRLLLLWWVIHQSVSQTETSPNDHMILSETKYMLLIGPYLRSANPAWICLFGDFLRILP